MKILKIIDGNALLFRAYFASSYGDAKLTTRGGVPTNAVYVFANMLNKILFPVEPGTHILVAFDTGEKTFRHQQLETYKAHRKPVPDDLIQQFPIARELLKALNLYTFELNGFEGDDVAGSAAIQAVKSGYDVEIYTSDRDFLQLVQSHISVHLIRKGVSEMEKMTREKVITTYGITPEQVVDYKGLVGDASDNLPGIPGIGEKTAIKLLQQYQTLEAILLAAPGIKGKVAENILNHQESGRLSKSLAVIHTTIPLPFTIDETLYPGLEESRFLQFVTSYEMSSLNGRFFKKTTTDLPLPTYERIHHLPELQSSPIRIVPLQATGNYFQHPLLGFALFQDQTGWVISLEDAQKDSQFLAMMRNEKRLKIVYDYKQFYVLAYRHELPLAGPFFDIMIAHYALDETPSQKREQVFATYEVMLWDDVEKQSIQIAESLLRIYEKLILQLKEKQLETIIYQIEFPLAQVLAKMEIEGLPLDVNYLQGMEKDLTVKLSQLTEGIYQSVGKTFNLDSPKQVSEVLFTDLKLPNPKKGSTNIEVLKQLLPLHPLIEKIIDYRKYAKLMSTYVKALPEWVYPDGKLHPIYQQVQTTTGRLSSFDPNIQNIAVKDEETKLIRKAFYYPDPNYVFLAFDYSQIELRILAELAQCQPLITAFTNEEDIHTLTAQKLFASAGGVVTPLMRRQAKAVNFGIIYGISAWGLSEQLGITPTEANALIETFYQTYPELKTYMQNLITNLESQKYVTTLLGRRRYLRDISGSNFQAREFAKRAAMNAPIQGTAADLIKVAMIQVDEALQARGYQTQLILTIHDELIFKTPKHELEKVKPLIQDIMEHALPLKVALKVAVHHAASWYELK